MPSSGVSSPLLSEIDVRNYFICGAKLLMRPHPTVDVGCVALRRKLPPVNAREGLTVPKCSPVLKASPSAQPCCLGVCEELWLCREQFIFWGIN